TQHLQPLAQDQPRQAGARSSGHAAGSQPADFRGPGRHPDSIAERRSMSLDGRDQYLQVAGARLRFRDTGSGPPVLLLHGWTLGLEMWDPQAAALSEEFRMVRFDRRGFGLSTGSASVIDDAADVVALCAHLKIRRAA